MSIQELEMLELENGALTANNYAILMTHYLLEGDILNAKFLWKRAPPAAQADEEFKAIWMAGQKLWSKDLPAFFAFIKQRQWSEGLGPLISQLMNKTRERAFRLLCRAYTTVRVAQLAAMTDLSTEEAVRFATNPQNPPDCLWRFDAASQMLEKVPATGSYAHRLPSCDNAAVVGANPQLQFQLLTGYVSFLEN